MTITTKTPFGESQTYEEITRIPRDFIVWNIGANMGSEDHIPVCKWLHPEKEDYSIDPATVKAFRLPRKEVKALRAAATIGINSLHAAEKALRSRRRGYWSNRKRTAAESTIDIFRRVTD